MTDLPEKIAMQSGNVCPARFSGILKEVELQAMLDPGYLPPSVDEIDRLATCPQVCIDGPKTVAYDLPLGIGGLLNAVHINKQVCSNP
jgi:hypothetical protein